MLEVTQETCNDIYAGENVSPAVIVNISIPVCWPYRVLKHVYVLARARMVVDSCLNVHNNASQTVNIVQSLTRLT